MTDKQRIRELETALRHCLEVLKLWDHWQRKYYDNTARYVLPPDRRNREVLAEVERVLNVVGVRKVVSKEGQ